MQSAQRFFYLFLILLLAGCYSKPKEKQPCPPGCGEKGKKPCPKNCVQTAPENVSQAKPDNIQFYLETSGSMNGYLKGGTEFKNVITDMVATLNGTEKTGNLNIYTISNAIAPYPGNSEKFIKDLALVPIANQKSSEMHKIFKNLADKMQGNDVQIFISDCILSFPDTDIKKNPRVNIESAPSTLKSFIKTTFQDYQKRGIVMNVYGFTSAFNGTYYDYQNKKTTLKGTQRPYYVWVMGKKELVLSVCQRLESQPAFSPAKLLSFGMSQGVGSGYMLLPSMSVGRNFNCLAPYREVVELKLEKSKNKAEDVWVAVDVRGMGGYLQDANTLKNSFLVSGNDKIKAEVLEVKPKSEALAMIKNVKERELFGDFSHAVKIRMSGLVGNEAKVELKLPYKADDWYLQWSTMDDSKVAASSEPKTFAFEHLVNGVKEAYQLNSQPNLLELAIPVKK